MASRKANYEGLMVQEFVDKDIAMAYTNMKNEPAFDELILPYVHVYQNSDRRSKGDFFIPELRKRKLELVAIEPTNYTR